ncbi:MAG: hypothetical protein K9L86_00515 [Candidatus Omnitrophica bacterium]|nr:hypothetical protein [Candidatus Omnitrophota bacterium]
MDKNNTHNTSKKTKYRLRAKVCISLFSLFFSLIVLEVVLRIIGHVYFSSRPTADEIFAEFQNKQGERVILCIGDSYTVGANVGEKNAWPSKLQIMLNEGYGEGKFHVVNSGVCEINSAQVLEILPRYIERYKPEIIIFLVGVANQFNFIGFDREAETYLKLPNFVYKLRTYKMLRIVALNIRQKIFKDSFEQDSTFATQASLSKRQLSKALNPDEHIFAEIADADYDLIEHLRAAGEHDKASDLFRKSVLVIDPNSELFAYYGPEFILDIYDDMYNSKTLSVDEVLSDFRKNLESNPSLKDDKAFMDYYSYLQSIDKFYKAKRIEQQLINDLDKIISVCRDNNVRIVIQNYPYPYPMIDKVIADVALKYSLTLVDQGRIFSRLIARNKREIYFQDDLHCTPLGYRIMAENIYNVFKQEDIGKIEP